VEKETQKGMRAVNGSCRE